MASKYGINYKIPYEDNLRWQTYFIWKGMNYRCHNEKSPSYKYYGARGITVCDQWKESFDQFVEDIGLRPDKSKSIDRLDPNGNYEPGNVAWNSAIEQAINKRYPEGTGVKQHKNHGLWEAYMKSYGKKIHLGSSPDREVAIKIRQSAERLRDHLRDIGVYV